MTFPTTHRILQGAQRSRLAALCAIALLAPVSAGAVGLGATNGSPVMGEPLTLEIPLIEPGTLSIDCFQLTPHPNGSDSQYFPRRAKLELKKRSDGTMTLLIQGAEFNQPVVEFRVGISCGTQVARDYVLLLAPSRELRYESVALNRPATAAASQPVTSVSPSPVDLSAKAGPSIEQMAASRFPNQAKARERFKRQLRDSNAAKLQGVDDHAPIPLAVDLKMPEEETARPQPAPAPRPGKKRPAPAPKPKKLKQAAPAPVVAPPPTAPVVKQAPVPVAEEKPKDRLSISTGVGLEGATQPTGAVDGATQAKADASFANQEEMAAKLAKAEASYNELKEQLQRMESRLVAMEQERVRLQEENKKQTDWSMLVGAISILGGGLLGALLMMMFQRRRAQRSDYEMPVFDIGDLGKK